MKNKINIILCIFIIGNLYFAIDASAEKIINDSYKIKNNLQQNYIISNSQQKNKLIKDINPLSGEKITVTIKEIRALAKIYKYRNPNFYVVLNINGKNYKSKIWRNQKYVKADWSVTVDIPGNLEEVIITIKLYDSKILFDKICDIAPNDGTYKYDYYAYLIYNLSTGHWTGSDYLTVNSSINDVSGYGVLNGCDDNSINTNERDCEIIFDITQSDPDGDGIPTWTEINVYKTDPMINDSGRDDDGDGVPIEWEWKWGYDPFKWEDHKHMDPDKDGLSNYEEYLTSKWGSDPFRKDIFLELDEMEIKNGLGAYVSQEAKDMLIDAFAKHNIQLHIDDPEEKLMDGGELIPFMEDVTRADLPTLYYNYFLHKDYNNWRQGVFHYGLVVYYSDVATGFAFWSGDENYTNIDSFLISTKILEKKIYDHRLINIISNKKLNRNYRKAVVYASAMMHETGHVLGIYRDNTPGCDNPDTYFPTQRGWWEFHPYKSCMNYAYTYRIVDYSDGSHGKNDYDDWDRIDLTKFQSE